MTTDTETRTAVQAAQKAESAAYSALRKLERERDEEISEAKERVRVAWQDRIGEASSAYYRAREDARDALVAASVDHEWEGKIVMRLTDRYARYGSRVLGQTVERGVVITYRPGVTLPESTARYNYPAIGSQIVRFLKKDGTPGVKFERLTDSWKLEETK